LRRLDRRVIALSSRRADEAQEAFFGIRRTDPKDQLPVHHLSAGAALSFEVFFFSFGSMDAGLSCCWGGGRRRESKHWDSHKVKGRSSSSSVATRSIRVQVKVRLFTWSCRRPRRVDTVCSRSSCPGPHGLLHVGRSIAAPDLDPWSVFPDCFWLLIVRKRIVSRSGRGLLLQA